MKAFSATRTDELDLGADVRHGQKREDNVTLEPLDNVSWDNETLEAPHSSSNLLHCHLSDKCTQLICFKVKSRILLSCFRVVRRARMVKQMYFMPRENPEDEVAKESKLHNFQQLNLSFQLFDIPLSAA